MRYLAATFSILVAAWAGARPHQYSVTDEEPLTREPPITEYAWGVQRLPLDGGGRMYGWKLNERISFGRFKGENDNFGFSVQMNDRQRVEITTDGFRWRRALGGGSK